VGRGIPWSDDAALAKLATVCGAEHVRGASPADAVAGMIPRFVAAPAHTAQVAALIAAAADMELTVLARGGGTKLDWCAPPRRVDLIVDMHRLSGLRQHTLSEAAVTVGAGTSLETLAITLAATGQRLAVDGFPPGATVGGVIAADAAGPCRLDHGSPRRLLLGAVVVTGDGRQTRVGVPASSAPVGLDLGPLFAGSFGALGLLTEVTVRLSPVPTLRRYLWRTVRSPLEAHDLTMALLAAEQSITGWTCRPRRTRRRPRSAGRGRARSPPGPSPSAWRVACRPARRSPTSTGGQMRCGGFSAR
jgi:glycolate oxidase FAD binding subunit